MITADQRKKVFALARQHGLDKETLYAVVAQVSGGDSISKLSKEQAVQLIDRLQRYTGSTGQPERGRKMASKQMLWKIGELEKQLGWADEPKRLQAFMTKYAGVERLEWLTHQKAWKLIESLKKMVERQRKGAV